MIVVDDIHKHFGGFHAVDGANLTIGKGTITGLIGPNGAGKTTLFNVIAGVLKPTSGRVTMDGEDITGLPPHTLFHKGLLRTFQIAHEFSSMTCRENLMMVPGDQAGETLWNTWFGRKRIADQDGRAFSVTASIGVARIAETCSPSMAMNSADGPLYAAKAAGRNMVRLAQREGHWTTSETSASPSRPERQDMGVAAR